jgi:hypothetical protein
VINGFSDGAFTKSSMRWIRASVESTASEWITEASRNQISPRRIRYTVLPSLKKQFSLVARGMCARWALRVSSGMSLSSSRSRCGMATLFCTFASRTKFSRSRSTTVLISSRR